ncbi:MAG TPA: O-antigen translocase [Flavobacterium sp.]|nr:O-antigen translocase [Flavobacterium sp.]
MFRNYKQNVLLKVFSLNSVSVLVSFVLGIFSTKIISVFLGTSGMAFFGSFKNFSGMLRSLATLGIGNSVIKMFVENKEDKKELSVIYSTIFWLFLSISVLLGIATIAFADPISVFLFYSESYRYPICFFGLFLPLMVINTFWVAIYNGLQHFKKIIAIQIISNIVVFGITAILIWQDSLKGGLFSFAFGELLMVIVTFLFIRKDKEYFKFDLQKIVSRKYAHTISKFSSMALLSAIIVPLTLILIRKVIIKDHSIEEAGVWDAVTRLSGFYMLFFNSGLALYYMPKLASLKTNAEFRAELKFYFTFLVPLFLLMLVLIFAFKSIILKIAFTDAFSGINKILIWQLLGDFFRIMILAFGYQIVVKTMIKKYFLMEIAFNVLYFGLSFFLVKRYAVEGALQAYFYTTVIMFVVMLVAFWKVLFGEDLDESEV